MFQSMCVFTLLLRKTHERAPVWTHRQNDHAMGTKVFYLFDINTHIKQFFNMLMPINKIALQARGVGHLRLNGNINIFALLNPSLNVLQNAIEGLNPSTAQITSPIPKPLR